MQGSGVAVRKASDLISHSALTWNVKARASSSICWLRVPELSKSMGTTSLEI